jgi:hypothetical protein
MPGVLDLRVAGLLERIQDHPDTEKFVTAFKDRASKEAFAFAQRLCAGKTSGVAAGRTAFKDSAARNYTFDKCLLPLGNGKIWGDGNCRVRADCKTKCFFFNCTLTYRVWDKFIDASDFFDRVPGDQEFPGGTPFEMSVDWSEEVRGQGQIP